MSNQNPSKRITRLIASPKFFWFIAALLIVPAAWIALSGRYPMAFDEDFHLGIIKLYAHHPSPFWAAQPSGADAFGAVFRDPSYLYQWLMSFPYRFIHIFTDSQMTIVLGLRALNIGFFAVGLALYRRLLLKTGASRAIVHLCLFLFVLIPVVPLLAAQINYDNLFLPLIAGILLLAVRFDNDLILKRINVSALVWLLVLCLLTSLVKYAFLPIFLALVIYMGIRLWRTFKGTGRFREAISAAFEYMGLWTRVCFILIIIASAGLFLERYGVNIVRYHTPVPDCGQALSVETCSSYGPWIRDYNLEQHKSPGAERSPLVFGADWFYGMWLRMFFAVDGPATVFQTRGPLILPGIGAIVFAASAAVLILAYGKRLFQQYSAAVLALMLTVTAVYVAVLWLDGYRTFLRVGQTVAVNGRYLFPVLPFLMVLGALAFNELCRGKDFLKISIAVVAVLCMIWGGGALTYILRSNDAWYWANSPLRSANAAIQRDIGPYVPGYRHPTEFMGGN